MPDVRTSIENRRGCGYRTPGGLYLMGGYPVQSCHRLPFELSVCTTCGQGVKPARGWTWIDGVKLFSTGCIGVDQLFQTGDKDTDHKNIGDVLQRELSGISQAHCSDCVVCRPMLLVPDKEFKGTAPEHFGQSSLIWIGEKFYPTPESFTEEANVLGVSRRISVVPNGFVLGETWVFFAHRLAVEDDDNPAVDKRHPGIFEAFMPTSIDYVIKGTEPDSELTSLEKRGINLVKVIPKDISEAIVTSVDALSSDDEADFPYVYPDIGFFDTGIKAMRISIIQHAGYTKVSDLNGHSLDVLLKISGIGAGTVAKIRKAISK